MSTPGLSRRPNSDSEEFLAPALRGFGPLGLLSIAAILITGNIPVSGFVVPVGALLVLAWVKLSNTPWMKIGYTSQASWVATVVDGVLLGVLLKLAMKSLVMPLLGADPVNRAYHYLAGNKAALPSAIWAMLMAGFAEETVFRGFLFERSFRLLGNSGAAKVVTVIWTSFFFGAVHYTTQGVAGVQQAVITGLVFGSLVAYSGRIWMAMIAHAVFDLTALAMIYRDAESKVAHFFFH